MTATTSIPRVIIAVAAETDDDIICGAVERVQRDMFAVGPVAIKLAYFGAEDAGCRRPFISTRWQGRAGKNAPRHQGSAPPWPSAQARRPVCAPP
jgi:hypothetical protein